jgi:hypothetical protein
METIFPQVRSWQASTHEKNIDQAGGFLKNALADREIISNHVPQYGIDRDRRIEHLVEQILHIEQVNCIVLS